MTKRHSGNLLKLPSWHRCDAALAHDVWLTLTGDAASRRVVINYGHTDDRPPPMADKVLDLTAIRLDGEPRS